jgi:Uma2 family endonuclease
MTGHVRNLMTADEFYTWLADQEDGKFELVGGEPRLVAGANRRHDRIAVNALWLLGSGLVGHSCQPFTSNIHIRIPNGNLRHADVGVECGRPPDDSMEADCPFLLIEILSPRTRAFDRNDKLEEYKMIEALSHILLVDPDFPQVRLYSRDRAGAWTSERHEGLEMVIEFQNLPVRLLLSELYDRLEFRPRPMLVDPKGQPKFGI